MKKLLLFVLIAVIFSACEKKEKTMLPVETEVSFSISEMMDGGLKSGNLPEWQCPTNEEGELLEPAYAIVSISTIEDLNDQTLDVSYQVNVFRLAGQLYTQSLKLEVNEDGSTKTYYVKSFLLYAANGDLIMGTPTVGAVFSEYVQKPVVFSFQVSAFEKLEIPIEVLCFMPQLYDYFGFSWFAVSEIVIREQCFFGDLCLKNVDDYARSEYYAQQSTGLQIDMPALFKIMAYKDGVLVPNNETFTNANDAHAWGVGHTVCVQYPDNLLIPDEKFTFELWIYVAVGDGFDYVKFYEWEFFDDEMIPTMNDGETVDDGVVDFVLGNCNCSSTNLQLPPYMNLPPTCTLTTLSNSNTPFNGVPGLIPIQGVVGYFDVALTGIPAGYEITNTSYAVNCFNNKVDIFVPMTYQMTVHSSLYPGTMTGPCKDLRWDQANWLINHLDLFPGYTWNDLQHVFWKIESNAHNMFVDDSYVPAASSIATDMYNAATNTANDGYVPLPGGWAAVAFEGFNPPTTDPTPTQCIFLRIDP